MAIELAAGAAFSVGLPAPVHAETPAITANIQYDIPAGPLKVFGEGADVFVSDRVATDNFSTEELDGWEQADAVLFYKRED